MDSTYQSNTGSYSPPMPNENKNLLKHDANQHVVNINRHDPDLQCRICLDTGGYRHEFTKPCVCDGSQRYVHKYCLDRWRATGQNPRGFTHCPTCAFEYHLEAIVTEAEIEGNVCGCCPARWCSGKTRFRMLVTRDFFFGFLVINFFLFVLAAIVRLIDNDEVLVDVFPFDTAKHEDLLYALKHHKATYYFTACCIVMFFMGIYACIFDFKTLAAPFRNQTEEETHTQVQRSQSFRHNAHAYGRPASNRRAYQRNQNNDCCNNCYCPDCHCYGCYYYNIGDCSLCCDQCCDTCCVGCGDCGDCGGCGDCGDCGGCGDCGDAGAVIIPIVLVIVAIIVLIFIFVGFFFGLVALMAWLQRILQRHLHVLHRKELAREYKVVDLEESGRLVGNVPRRNNNIRDPAAAASAPIYEDLHENNNMYNVMPSAPPPEHYQAAEQLSRELHRW